ncbi:MAG: zinc-dependent alcohol dehydrogenase family protein [Candidatus Sumerlaeaceae bacterium]|nr:zinc-dependent alcohol dehydrogenase family protein [Candidatus Sumerlaeaceae bacterium]
MKIVVVNEFGDPEKLTIQEAADPIPARGEVRVRLTSVGINHADLMARRGEYKLYSGDPPFTPGLEGAGFIEAVGEDVSPSLLGEFVVLDARAPRRTSSVCPVEGTYRTHYVVPAGYALPVPAGVPHIAAGTLWLSHLTAWGCLIWKQHLLPGQVVAIPAASSSVGLAASQVAQRAGAKIIGLTRSEAKAEILRTIPEARFDWIVVTHEPDGRLRPWHREIMRITEGHGVDVFFDPVAGGAYLDSEIRCLRPDGTIWIYGLLEKAGPVDLTPLIRKRAAVRGWVLGNLLEHQELALAAQKEILRLVASGEYCQRIAKVFPLEAIREAHSIMERGEHVGKFVLSPSSE